MIEPSFGLVLIDESGRLTQVDRLACELLGYPAPHLVGMTVQSLTHPEDWEVCRRLLERLYVHDEPFSLAKRYLRCDGSPVWAQAYVTLVRDAVGRATVSAMIRPVLPGPGLPGLPVLGLPGSGLPGSGLPGSGLPGAGLPGSGLPGLGLPAEEVPREGLPEQGRSQPDEVAEIDRRLMVDRAMLVAAPGPGQRLN